MKRATKFLTLFSTTLVSILLVTSFPNVKTINSQFLSSHKHLLIFQKQFQINFNTSYNLNSNIYRNQIRINQRKKVIPFIVQIFILIGNFLIFLIILIRDLLIALLNPVLGILVTVCVGLKYLFGEKWKEVRVKIPVIKNSIGKVILRNYEGTIIRIPTRIYKCNYCSIELNLTHQAIKNNSSNSQQSSNPKQQGSPKPWIVEKVQLEQGQPTFLELELSSPGFKTDDEKKQRQSLDLDKLHYSWNCKIDNSGKHRLNLIFKLHNSVDTKLLSKEGWDVKVVELLGLTGEQYNFITKTTTIATYLCTGYLLIAPFLPPELRFFVPPKSTQTPTPPTSTTPTPPPTPSSTLSDEDWKRIRDAWNSKPTPTPSSSSSSDFPTGIVPGVEPNPTRTVPSLIPGVEPNPRRTVPSLIPGVESNPMQTVPSLIPGVESNPTQTVPSVIPGVIPSVEPNPTQTVPSVIPGVEPNPTPSRSPSSNESDVLEPYY